MALECVLSPSDGPIERMRIEIISYCGFVMTAVSNLPISP